MLNSHLNPLKFFYGWPSCLSRFLSQWRTRKGTWFPQSICSVFGHHFTWSAPNWFHSSVHVTIFWEYLVCGIQKSLVTSCSWNGRREKSSCSMNIQYSYQWFQSDRRRNVEREKIHHWVHQHRLFFSWSWVCFKQSVCSKVNFRLLMTFNPLTLTRF